MSEILPRWLVTGLVSALFVANTINIGADIAAMGAAAEMVVGGARMSSRSPSRLSHSRFSCLFPTGDIPNS